MVSFVSIPPYTPMHHLARFQSMEIQSSHQSLAISSLKHIFPPSPSHPRWNSHEGLWKSYPYLSKPPLLPGAPASSYAAVPEPELGGFPIAPWAPGIPGDIHRWPLCFKGVASADLSLPWIQFCRLVQLMRYIWCCLSESLRNKERRKAQISP